MKSIIAAITTFFLGICAAYLFVSDRQPGLPEIFAPIELARGPVVTTATEVENTPGQAPFFDSFEDEVGFNGWLIPKEFTGMKEVWTILLSREWEKNDNSRLVWSAMVLTNNSDGTSNDTDMFESISITTSKDRLIFTTNKIRGVQYKFDGRFTKEGRDFSDNEMVLTGTMQKFIKGKRAARFTAQFSYSEPVCFH